MPIILKILLILILIPVALLLIALFTPVFYEIFLRYDNRLTYEIYLYGIKLKFPKKRPAKKSATPKPIKSKPKRKLDLKKLAADLDFFIKYPDKEILLKQFANLVSKILKALRPKVFEADGEFGLADVAATGQVYGALWAFGIINNNINLQPNFEKEIITANVRLKGRIMLWLFAWPALTFILSPRTLKLISTILKRYKKPKINKNNKNNKINRKAVNYGVCGSSG